MHSHNLLRVHKIAKKNKPTYKTNNVTYVYFNLCLSAPVNSFLSILTYNNSTFTYHSCFGALLIKKHLLCVHSLVKTPADQTVVLSQLSQPEPRHTNLWNVPSTCGILWIPDSDNDWNLCDAQLLVRDCKSMKMTLHFPSRNINLLLGMTSGGWRFALKQCQFRLSISSIIKTFSCRFCWNFWN